MKCSSTRCIFAAVALLSLLTAGVTAAAEATVVPNGHDSIATIDASHSAPPPSVLDESFRDHHHSELPKPAPRRTVAPPRGWYRYGFPAETHRWGWFGAEHYYPRVLWHHGYYGDLSRWSYRRGY